MEVNRKDLPPPLVTNTVVVIEETMNQHLISQKMASSLHQESTLQSPE
jgi:hypothetical protein